MASIICNVYDESGNSVDCNYQGYHYNTGNWSEVYATELTQISFDTENSDWDGNGIAVPSGDILLVKCWTATESCVFRITSDGSSTYVLDVQLKGSVAPTLSSSIGEYRVADNISVSRSASDEYQWTFGSETMYHKNNWYGQNIFGDVGISSIEYDFNNEGYGLVNNWSSDVFGLFPLKVRATNNNGQEVVNEHTIIVRKRIPEINMSHTPTDIYTTENTTVSVSVTDLDNGVTDERWYSDGTEVLDLEHSYNTVGNHEFKAVIDWNDGFNDLVEEEVHIIYVRPRPPQISTVYTIGVNNEYMFDSTIIPGDGTIADIEYVIYYKVPISDASIEIYRASGSEDENFTFQINGEYIMTIKVKDSYNESDMSTTIFNVECLSSSILKKYKMNFDQSV